MAKSVSPHVAVAERLWTIRVGIVTALSASGCSTEEFEGTIEFPPNGRSLYSLFVLGPNGFEQTLEDSVKQLRLTSPRTPILVWLNQRPCRLEIVNVLKAGATACLTTTVSSEEFRLALKAVLRGRRFLSPPVADLVCDLLIDPGAAQRITNRESQVLRLLSDGLTVKEIAQKLNIGNSTVESHKKNLMRKMGVHSQLSLVATASRFI